MLDKPGETHESQTLKLAENLKKGHVLFIDRLYSSYKVIQKLLQKDIYVCGTTRGDRGFPSHLQEKENPLQPGDWNWSCRNGVVAYAWQDSAHCQLLSSFHLPEDTTVLRRARGHEGRIVRHAPTAYEAFNRFMGGNDCGDMIRSRISCHLKSNKWWRSVFYYVIDQVLITIFRIWNEGATIILFAIGEWGCIRRGYHHFCVMCARRLLENDVWSC